MQRGFLFVLIVFSFTWTGCNSGPALPPDLPKLSPCVITVTQDGAPLDGAMVSLLSMDGNQQWFPGGRTDASGKVELFTNGRYKGVPHGKYKIVITKTETDPSTLGPAPDKDASGYDAWLRQSAAEVLQSYSSVEKQYAKAETTPLEIDMAGGKVDKTVDVGKKVRDKI